MWSMGGGVRFSGCRGGGCCRFNTWSPLVQNQWKGFGCGGDREGNEVER